MIAPRFDERVPVVTAGAAGFGEATVRRLIAEGATVPVGDADDERLDALQGEFGERFVGVQCDVTQDADADGLIGGAVDRFGRIDAAFNVAGGGGGGSIHESEESQWRFTVDLCPTGTFFSLKQVARAADGARERRRDRQRRVELCADAGRRGRGVLRCEGGRRDADEARSARAARAPNPGERRFSGVAASPRMTAAERVLGDSYREQTALGRIVEPERVAAALASLASDDARLISGVCLLVDGAFSTTTRFDPRPLFAKLNAVEAG